MFRISALIAVLVCGQEAAFAGRSLTPKEVELLVANIPPALEMKRHGGCPTPEYSDWSPGLAMVQLRNSCPRSGSGFIGNYVVDLHSGKIWSDIDRKSEVDSPRLLALRKRLLKAPLNKPGSR